MAKGYGEAMALLEMGKQMGLAMANKADDKKPHRTTPMKKDKDKDIDLLALMEQKRREYLAIKQFIEEQGKLAKPDEKKEEKKKSGISERDMVIFLMAFSPILGAVALGIMRWVLQI